MRKLIYSLLWAVCGMSAAPAQAQHAFRVMEYNVENLFDCRHDSLKQDTEFLPGSVRNWTYRRFQDKVNKIGKVILAAGKEQVPDLVGLCEVENDYCLKSLTRYSPLREVGYKYVMTSCPMSVASMWLCCINQSRSACSLHRKFVFRQIHWVCVLREMCCTYRGVW